MHVLVTGKIQGVGFRAFVKRCATKFGLKGFVRNLKDGRVEICLQGAPEKITDFFQMVLETFTQGSIAHLEKNLRPQTQAFSSFEIL